MLFASVPEVSVAWTVAEARWPLPMVKVTRVLMLEFIVVVPVYGVRSVQGTICPAVLCGDGQAARSNT